MKYSIVALTALLVPPQAMMLQACETTAQGILALAPDEPRCHPWPSCTSWTVEDTTRKKDVKAKRLALKRGADSMDVLIGEFDFTTSGEFARLDLEEGQIYRVEFTARQGSLQIRPRRSNSQPLLPLRIEDAPRASGTVAMEIAPREDGEYDFRVSGMGGIGARIRVYREISPSARWQRISSASNSGS
jgi:hypothetical protein